MVNHPHRSKQQQAKHTPGSIDSPEENAKWPGPPTWQSGTYVAGCVYQGDKLIADCRTHHFSTFEAINHARLIAAAPELLAALKTANDVLRNIAAPFGVKNGNEAIGEARLSEIRASVADTSAAIAKAEGR